MPPYWDYPTPQRVNYFGHKDSIQPEWEERDNRAVDTFILLLFFSDFWDSIGISLRIIPPLNNYLSILGQIEMSRNLQGRTFTGILSFTRVVRHAGQTTDISIVSHKMRSCIEIDNAHYLVSYFIPTMLLFNI